MITKLLKHLEALENENKELKQENEILKMSVIDTYDSANDMIFELQEISSNLKQENEKLKQALEILKEQIRIIESYASMFREKGSEKTYRVDIIIGSPYITQQDYELLKEVLGNE